MSTDPTALVQAWFNAMQRGAAGEEDLIGLFAEDATYIQPFGPTGQPAEHTGKPAIRRALQAGWAVSPPGLVLTVDRMDHIGDGHVRTAWTCTSPAFPHPMKGVDETTVRDGAIVRLETRLEG